MHAYFTEGALISDHQTLLRVGEAAGLDAGEIRTMLDGDTYAEAVRADEEQALDRGISGVPYFVIDGAFAISGAQHADVMLDVLERAWASAQSRPSAP